MFTLILSLKYFHSRFEMFFLLLLHSVRGSTAPGRFLVQILPRVAADAILPLEDETSVKIFIYKRNIDMFNFVQI